MTPRRESHLDNNGEDNNDDFRAYEVDGWRVGYEIEMNGVGIVDDRASDDGSGFPDTDPETDDDLDLDDDEAPCYPGYRTLPFQMEERVSENVTSCDEGIDQNESTSSEGVSVGDTEEAPAIEGGLLQEKSAASGISQEEVIPHQPNSIILDDEKIQAIREAMSGFTLPSPPEWANLDTVKLNEIINEKSLHSSLAISNNEVNGIPNGYHTSTLFPISAILLPCLGSVNMPSIVKWVKTWCVVVPRYLSDLWEANAGTDVGRLVKLKSRPGLVLPASISSSLKGPAKIPDEHSFILGDVLNQTMAVLAEDKTGLNEEAEVKPGRLSIEGRVVKRAECRPPASSSYLKMKIAQISSSGQPKKQVLQMEKAAVKFKPVAAHAEDMMRIKQKKEGAKRPVRADRNVYSCRLCYHAFEKHQYYRLQDLQQLTQQPAGYVKELLTEIAVYNTAPPHKKSMWELKPEYRDYAVPKYGSHVMIRVRDALNMVDFVVQEEKCSRAKWNNRIMGPSHAEACNTVVYDIPSSRPYTTSYMGCCTEMVEIQPDSNLSVYDAGFARFLESDPEIWQRCAGACGMPKNSAVHLQISDPLGEWRPGFNDTKSIAVFTKGGKRMLDPRMYREIVRNFMCDSFDTMLDYDVPRGSLKQTPFKAMTERKRSTN
ncbi:transcription initiation factor IIF, beta subunit [Ostertagia ostertagi]